MIDLDMLMQRVPDAYQGSSLPLSNLHSGKVRDWYDLPGGRRLIVTSDRLSAFDRNLAVVPF